MALLVSCFLIGMFVIPLAMAAMFEKRGFRDPSFYEALFRPEVGAWIVVLLPYLLVQGVRSIVWAIRTLKAR
jgi:hypothetical protein